ncbi:MAG: hypothetical protein FK734_17600 [Asgard group archaeon]|nr:hypothetical protein [Asgard group archaeon]
MNNKKLGLLTAVIIVFIIPIFIVPTATTLAEGEFYHYIEGDYFIWDVDYNVSLPVFGDWQDFNGTCKIEMNSVYSEVINYIYTDSNDGYYSSTMRPDETVRNFPMGTTETLTTVPYIYQILPKLFLISNNWSTSSLMFYNGTYNFENGIEDIENPYNSTYINHNRYFFKGALREVCIFYHVLIDDYLETFNINGMRFNGDYQAVYSEKTGLLLKFEMNLWQIGNTQNTIELNIELKSTNTRVGLSWYYKLFITLITIFGPILLVNIIAWCTMAIQIIIKLTPEKEIIPESAAKEEAPDIKKLVKKDHPEDYYFIERCPFCNEVIPKGQEVCPKCKGRR